ncbi:MAG: histidine phosphatase family protein [Myxococcota bacterium]|nr:histidine phosphatase family protein [Myxococcota bacterium]
MNTWLFIRHGQSQANVEEWFSGQIDVELTDQGVQEAQALGVRLRDQEIHRVLASDLVRARRTADIALGERELPLTVDKRLRERHCGVFQGQSVMSLKANGGYDLLMTLDGRPEGGESLRDVAIRAARYLATVPPSDEVIAVVCHGALMRSLLGAFDGRPADRVSEWKPRNCEHVVRRAHVDEWGRLAMRLTGQ